jgi:hypothetical protein
MDDTSHSVDLKALDAELAAQLQAQEDDDEDDAPRIQWSTDEPEERPPTESVARRMMKRMGFLGGSNSARGEYGGGEKAVERGSSLSRLIFSESSDGTTKAFRGVRKLASRARKAATGVSVKEVR